MINLLKNTQVVSAQASLGRYISIAKQSPVADRDFFSL